ncbi:hypothetical protein NDU88_002594 [Pleurodeles waltl]|uniref:Uncharacterized protein n=1 Tax=Pleurodeles waltl TaxID=8319 RepID=A0AAV7M119_PLEWA|nr:hypothetical protein NDU88_002594 [Pleurodeles waltl]
MDAHTRTAAISRRTWGWNPGIAKAPEPPATNNGGLQAAQYPGGTTGEELENSYIRNPDIQIPVEKKPVECPQQNEETEQDDAEAWERRSDGTRGEWSHPEQQTQEENLDGRQGSPETRRLHRVRGGA